MIKVKAFRNVAQGNRPPGEDYFAEKKEQRSALSIAFLLVISTVLAYLKSFFPSHIEAAPDEQQKSKSAADEQQIAPEKSMLADAEPDDDITGSTDDETVGSNVVPIAFRQDNTMSPENFLASNVPPIDFSRLDRNTVVNLHDPAVVTPRADIGSSGGDGARGTGGGGGGGDGESGRGTGRPDQAGNSTGNGSNGAAPDNHSNGPDVIADDPSRNRAPRTSGPVRLQDVVGCQALFIPFAALLAGTIDPDGDSLTVLRVTASSGTLVSVEGGWMFTPASQMLGEIVLSYHISDGDYAVPQTAHFDVEAAPPIIGTDGDDHLVGTDCGELIDGKGGNDTIDAKGGNDIIFGGSGDDYILAGAGNDTVYAGSGQDTVLGGAGNDYIFGEAGNDILFGEEGNDVISGGDGNDTINGGTGDDVIYAGSGADIAFGGSGRDQLFGDAGDDTLLGEDGDDEISGGDDNDILRGGAGNDVLSGDTGNDIVDGGEGSDTMYGGAGNDVIDAGNGDNIAFGGAGNDSMFGGADHDTLIGDDGDDEIRGGASADTLLGNAGSDKVSGDAGDDVIDGGEGDDTLTGGDGDDVLLAGDGNDRVSGNDGDDFIDDGAGCDLVEGGNGDDYVVASAGAVSDIYDGGDGEDTIDYSTATLSVRIDLGNGTATGADIGEDLITSFERAITGSGDDHLIAGRASVQMTGGSGRDKFEFRFLDDQYQPDLVRQITDFSIGDRLIMASYEIRYRESEDVDDAIDGLFDNIYLSSGSGGRPIRFRFEDVEDDHRTFVDLMNEDESHGTFSVELFGHHDTLQMTIHVT